MRKGELLPWVGFAVRVTAAGIWLFAGVTKLADLDGFRAQVDAYQVLPHALVSPFSYGLPLVEVAIGAYLLVGAMVRPTAILACVLMVIFLVAEAQAWARGLSIDCGCFGTTVQTQVGAATILRDIALGVPSALMAWRPARKLSVDASLLGREDAFAPGRGAGVEPA
ncbi:MAG TPA: MauE/DoxX family redox-associated membrane protein [Gaiellales bacterium]|nr:MauE/DoxX family redox-associated membrane protein [Gaiellales bacterium]HVI35269.1 MauE/DoxX family redox-associated membrane protein [Gaiellales bacterium]